MIGCLEKFAHDAVHDPGRVLYDFLDCETEPFVGHPVTNIEAWKNSMAIAGALKEKGARPGDRAIILSMQDAGTVYAVWGCMIAGVTFTVIPPPIDQGKMDRFVSVLKSCNPRFLISNEGLEKSSGNNVAGQLLRKAFRDVVALKRIYTDKVRFQRFEDVYPWRDDEVIYLQYTSGSTSAPKGVMITYGNLRNCIQLCSDAFDFRRGNNLASWVPFYHNIGLVVAVFIPIIADVGVSYFIPTLQFLANPRIWLKVMSQYKINITVAPNSAYEVCTRLISPEEAKEYDLQHVALMINGSEFVDNRTIQKFCSLFDLSPDCFTPGYGLSECVCVATVSCRDYTMQNVDSEAYQRGRFVPVEGDGKEIVSVGYPRNGLIVATVRPDGTLCDPDEIGEIYIQGPNVCSGYFRNEEETQRFHARIQGMEGDFYRTGDMGIVYDGQLYLTGRIKEMIVIHGKNVFPSDIVLLLNRNGVKLPMDSMTIFARLQDGMETPIFVSEANDDDDFKALSQSVNRVVSEHFGFSFSDVVFVKKGSLPRTDNRKVKTLEAKRLYELGRLESIYTSAGQGGEAAANDTVTLTADSDIDEIRAFVENAFRTALPTRDFGIDDSFIQLGGDSLSLVALTSELEERLHLDIDLRLVAANPTVRALSGLLHALLRGEQVSVHPNLYDECVLPDDVQPAEGEVDLSAAKKVLLTGSTGFLGAYLIRALIEQRGDKGLELYCHARAADKAAAMERIVANLKKHNCYREEYLPFIKPVVGELSEPGLGIELEEYEELSWTVDTVIHNGAILNFILPYDSLKKVNVEGTQEAVRFAAKNKKKTLVYISSYSVYDNPSHFRRLVSEDDPLDSADGYFLGYSETKWVSEQIVKKAREKGLPTVVIRPGDITGTVADGIWKVEDLISRSLVGCIQMEAVPEISVRMHLTPVDYVANAIAAIAFRSESQGHAFNVINRNILPVRSLTNYMRSRGYRLRTLSYEDWCALLESKSPEENVLRVLSCLFTDKHFAGESLRERFADDQAEFDTSNTDAALKDTWIACPPMDKKMIDSYISYFSSLGYFAKPGFFKRIVNRFVR